jgi:hypothetical protein
MSETPTESIFESFTELPATPDRTAPQHVPEALSEVLSEVATTPREGGTNSHPPIWEPTEPQFTKAIASYYSVSRKTVQEWFQKIKEACPWFPESDLKLTDDRYTPMSIHLMGRYRTSGLPFKAWKAQIWEENAELVAAFQASQQSQQANSSSNADRPPLPPVDRTAASSLVPTGSSYLSALKEEELELEQLETQELELLGRMHGNLERLTQNQTQWQRTNDLRRQRLLRQTRLEAATLATELEAEFDETLRESQYNIRCGNVGKPPVVPPPSQSA